jgi:sugar phosphate isomerase/epimerase
MKRKDQNESRTNRRSFFKKSALAVGAFATGNSIMTNSLMARSVNSVKSAITDKKKNPTRFTHACMTLPYRNYSLERALQGIKNAGYDHVAWGTQHRDENGENRPVMAETAPPEKAAELARRCRDMGLEPVQMFSTIYPDQDNAVELLTNRIKQASAAELDYVLVFGPTSGGDPDLWIQRFKQLAPIAADYNVTLAIKQHGGETTGTGRALAKIINEVNHPNIWMSYDAGNVFWYQDVDPIPDIQSCADLVRAFCLKDCRTWPTKTTSAPGYGEIDHYQLFAPVAFTGKTITLTYENIYPSYLGQPATVEEIDQLAKQAKLYMENVIAGVQKTMTTE